MCLVRVYRRLISISLLIFVLALSMAPYVCAGPAGSPAQAVVANIVVVPNTVGIKGGKIVVYGSGFTPGSRVTVGFPWLRSQKKLPEIKGLWIGVATINESGAFALEANLKDSLGRLVSRKIMKKEELLGVHTLVAKNKEGEVATAPFLVKEEKKKK